MVAPRDVLVLYRSLLRQGNLFQSFNYRMYALRKVRDSFKVKKLLSDPSSIQVEYEKGLQSLEMLKRQRISAVLLEKYIVLWSNSLLPQWLLEQLSQPPTKVLLEWQLPLIEDIDQSDVCSPKACGGEAVSWWLQWTLNSIHSIAISNI